MEKEILISRFRIFDQKCSGTANNYRGHRFDLREIKFWDDLAAQLKYLKNHPQWVVGDSSHEPIKYYFICFCRSFCRRMLSSDLLSWTFRRTLMCFMTCVSVRWRYDVTSYTESE